MDVPLQQRRTRIASSSSSLGWTVVSYIFLFVGLAMAVCAFGMTIHLMIRDKGNIRLIQGVPPVNNEVFNLQGPGIDVIPSVSGNSITFSNTGVLSNVAGDGIAVSSATGDVTISNTGVLTVNGRTPSGAGDILLTSPMAGIIVANGGASNEINIINSGVVENVAGAGISVSSPTGSVTISNTGVLEAVAGTGIGVSAGTGSVTISNTGILSVAGASGITANTVAGATTVTHDLTVQTALDDNDANGPQVRYTSAVAGDMGNWTQATLAIIDNGQGAVGASAWEVPSIGVYDVRAHCTADNATDYSMMHGALTFAATDADPTVGGAYIAGKSSTGIPALQESFASIQVSALVHAGCTGCAVSVGDALGLHLLVDGADSTMACDIQVAKVM